MIQVIVCIIPPLIITPPSPPLSLKGRAGGVKESEGLRVFTEKPEEPL